MPSRPRIDEATTFTQVHTITAQHYGTFRITTIAGTAVLIGGTYEDPIIVPLAAVTYARIAPPQPRTAPPAPETTPTAPNTPEWPDTHAIETDA